MPVPDEILPGGDDLLRRLHDVYHAPASADLHQAPSYPEIAHLRGPQPGTGEFSARHLVGSSAPEPHIERWDGIGPEGFGPVEILDGRTGQPIARLNSAARRRLKER